MIYNEHYDSLRTDKVLKKIDTTTEHTLYEYFTKISNEIPFYFPIDFDFWHKSMFNECDWTDEEIPLFDKLETYLYYENELLKGFIQFGLSGFVLNDNGKDFNRFYAIIRNIHYSEDSKNPEEMIEKALQFFNERNINEIEAFFHYFGMSCYARHGKLHESAFYIENLLNKYSFKKVHENIYFSKDLISEEYCCDPEISYKIQDIDRKMTKMVFFVNNEQIGYCEFTILQNTICYLYNIAISQKFRGQGWGIKCMEIIFTVLKKKRIKKIDLDTIDTNIVAQNFYTKLGFINKGITRSYNKDQEK